MTTSIFANPHYFSDPYSIFASIRVETPVYKTHLPDGREIYLVTRYQDVQSVLKDNRFIKNVSTVRPGVAGSMMVGNNMLKSDPPQHTRLRALAHSAFTPKFVNQLRGHIQQLTDQLLDAMAAKTEVDLIQAYAFPLPITVICEMLGAPIADEHLFKKWSSALIESGLLSSESPTPIPELYELTAYVGNLIQEREKSPADDLISALIHVDEGGDKLNQVELISTLIVLLGAGHETTVNLIGNGALALLQNPDQLALLKNDPTLIKVAVEELLRYVNPVHLINRYASEDVEIGGMPVAKGSHLWLVVAAANHDPAYIENPEALHLAQGNTQHLAFGQGIHYCLGAPLARLEGEIAFTSLLRRFPDIHLAVPVDQLQWRPTLELHGLKALPVRLI